MLHEVKLIDLILISDNFNRRNPIIQMDIYFVAVAWRFEWIDILHKYI